MNLFLNIEPKFLCVFISKSKDFEKIVFIRMQTPANASEFCLQL